MELVWALLQIATMLAAVVALAYFLLNKVMGRWLAKHQRSATMVLKERLALEPRRSIYIVEIRGRDFVLAGSENGVSLVCELNEKSSL
ncbi:MAG: flagellar biosynthetic protein FliO [Myxococcota bacterium]